MAAKREPGVAVKYWVLWSKEKWRPRSSVTSRVDARPPHACSPVSKTVAWSPREESSCARTRPETPPPTTAIFGTYPIVGVAGRCDASTITTTRFG